MGTSSRSGARRVLEAQSSLLQAVCPLFRSETAQDPEPPSLCPGPKAKQQTRASTSLGTRAFPTGGTRGAAARHPQSLAHLPRPPPLLQVPALSSGVARPLSTFCRDLGGHHLGCLLRLWLTHCP